MTLLISVAISISPLFRAQWPMPPFTSVATGGSLLSLNDCNGNGVPDDVDLSNGTSFDCNGDARPDECGVLDECEVAKLTPAPADTAYTFGRAVAIDGNRIVVGAPNVVESVYVFDRIGGAWIQTVRLVAPEPGPARFGLAVAIDGNLILVGAKDAGCPGPVGACGAAHVYRFNGANWIHETRLTASDGVHGDYFGNAVAVSGNVAIIGAYRTDCAVGFVCGAAYVFRFNGTTWDEEAKLVASDAAQSDAFGYSVSLKGTSAIIGSVFSDCDAGSNCGAAYVFHFDGALWNQEAKVLPIEISAGANFGHAVSLAEDSAIVGAWLDKSCPEGLRCGAAYILRFSNSTWSVETKLVASDPQESDGFGGSVSMSGDTVLVGAGSHDCPGGFSCGAAYLFRQKGALWVEDAKILASDTAQSDYFAFSVALGGDSALIGSVNGLHDDCPECLQCGAAYVFAIAGPDCNCNATADTCDIVDGSSQDVNGNLAPDECEPIYGDIFPVGGNLVLDVDDILIVLGGFIDPILFPAADIFPCDGNGIIDVDDILAELSAFSGDPACVWSNGMWVPN